MNRTRKTPDNKKYHSLLYINRTGETINIKIRRKGRKEKKIRIFLPSIHVLLFMQCAFFFEKAAWASRNPTSISYILNIEHSLLFVHIETNEVKPYVHRMVS
jgi:hypothetical protein